MSDQHLINGEPVFYNDQTAYREVCCDCCLSHLIIYKIVGKRITVVNYRDDYKTKRLRKREGIKIVRNKVREPKKEK